MRDTLLITSNHYLSGARLFTRVFFFVCLATTLTVWGEGVPRPSSPSSGVSRGSLGATLQPRVDLKQPARTSGIIEKFGAEENQPVNQGELVVQLNADMERAEVLRAEAGVKSVANDVARTKADLMRVEKLRNDSIGSEKEQDDARFAHEGALRRKEEAELNLAMARVRLNDRTTYAAVSGIVVRRFRSVGEFVDRGEQIARIMDTSKLHLEVYAGAELLGKFTQGQDAKVLLEDGSAQGTIIPAKVIGIDPFILPETGTFRIKLEVEPSEKVRVGMYGILQLPSEVH